MAQVRARVPDALLVIAGTGPLAAQLAARVAERGLGDHVVLAGFVADERLPAFYRACNVSIVPSLALEGFGLTTIESLASGTPVLVTPVGGLPETVAALDPGLVLPAATPDALAAGLVAALLGVQRLPSSRRCADYARRRFDWPVIAERTMAVYA
jgi:glycosyltransferase involved in cell wall biosynthesis